MRPADGKTIRPEPTRASERTTTGSRVTAARAWLSRNHEDARLLPDPRELDQPTLDRLCVNLLRHEHTGYDDTLASTFGQTGRNPAIRVIRFRIHRGIARQWPGGGVQQKDRRDGTGPGVIPDQPGGHRPQRGWSCSRIPETARRAMPARRCGRLTFPKMPRSCSQTSDRPGIR